MSLRAFFRLHGDYPKDLPASGGAALVVAGLDGCLDSLTPQDAAEWLEADFKKQLFGFQTEYEGQAALIFWIPNGKHRIKQLPARDEYIWVCAAPFSGETLPIGRYLFAGAESDARRVIPSTTPAANTDTAEWIALYHPRIS